jgi:hypothetical protein
LVRLRLTSLTLGFDDKRLRRYEMRSNTSRNSQLQNLRFGLVGGCRAGG